MPPNLLSMSSPTPLAQQLAEESRAKQRQYVLTNTRTRWGFVGFGAALLAGVRIVGLVPVEWLFTLTFAAAFAAINYAMFRAARDTPFRVWYAHLDLAVGAAMISAVLYAIGPTGHLLYAAYLITPLQAALYL